VNNVKLHQYQINKLRVEYSVMQTTRNHTMFQKNILPPLLPDWCWRLLSQKHSDFNSFFADIFLKDIGLNNASTSLLFLRYLKNKL